MTRELAMVHAKEGIRINSLCPSVSCIVFIISEIICSLCSYTAVLSKPVSLVFESFLKSTYLSTSNHKLSLWISSTRLKSGTAVWSTSLWVDSGKRLSWRRRHYSVRFLFKFFSLCPRSYDFFSFFFSGQWRQQLHDRKPSIISHFSFNFRSGPIVIELLNFQILDVNPRSSLTLLLWLNREPISKSTEDFLPHMSLPLGNRCSLLPLVS